MKLTSEQKTEIKRLRQKIASERRYKPVGQGDGMNQDLKIRELYWNIEQIKQNKGNLETPFGDYRPSR